MGRMMRGKKIAAETEESWIKAPSALTFWTLGTGVLGGIASIVLTKRAEREGWTKFRTSAIVAGVIIASALNLVIASKIKGE